MMKTSLTNLFIYFLFIVFYLWKTLSSTQLFSKIVKVLGQNSDNKQLDYSSSFKLDIIGTKLMYSKIISIIKRSSPKYTIPVIFVK